MREPTAWLLPINNGTSRGFFLEGRSHSQTDPDPPKKIPERCSLQGAALKGLPRRTGGHGQEAHNQLSDVEAEPC